MKKLVFGLAIAAMCAANAIPTITGPTGGFEVPTAAVATGVQIAVDQPTNNETTYDGVFPTTLKYPNTRVLVGVAKGLEIGGMYEKTDSLVGLLFSRLPVPATSGRDVWNVNAKYQLLDVKGLTVAVGGGFGEPCIFANNHVWNGYLAATKSVFGVKATANVGYIGVLNGAVPHSVTGALGLEKPVGEKSAVGAEFVFGDKILPIANEHGNIYVTTALGRAWPRAPRSPALARTSKPRWA